MISRRFVPTATFLKRELSFRKGIHRRLLIAAATATTSVSTFSTATMSSKPLPRALVFDLDGCLWAPEMYELWGRGGAPFTLTKNGSLKDRGGEEVQLLGDVRNIMLELKTDEKWKDTVIGVASTCDEPTWARECIEKVDLHGNLSPAWFSVEL